MNSSSTDACTRIRERAQQSWPALPNTAIGAAAAAASRSASANTMFGDLPPSSSVTRLIVCGRAGRDRAADLGRAGERDLGDVGMLDEPLRRTTRPGPTTTLTTPSGDPGLAARARSNRSAVSGVSSAGLSTTVLPAASAGPSFQEAIASGKFHGTISPTTPSGSRTVNACPPATGIVSPSSRSGAPA